MKICNYESSTKFLVLDYHYPWNSTCETRRNTTVATLKILGFFLVILVMLKRKENRNSLIKLDKLKVEV